jgi:cell wall-associated NlpC family hydrolase
VTRVAAAGAAALVLVAILPAVAAHAEPPKTVAQAQAQIDSLNERAEVVSEQLNAAQDRLTKATLAARAATATATTAQARLGAVREKVGAFAAQAYKSGGAGQTMLATVLTTNDPTQSLQKIATLQHLSAQQSDGLRAAHAADLRYTQALKAATQATSAANAIAASIAKQKQQIDALISQSQQVLDRLSADQRAKVRAAQQARAAAAARAARAAQPVSRALVRPGIAAVAVPQSSGGSGIAQRAVAAALSKLGSRYVYGAGGAATFDCSGLVQWSYRQAGVSTAHYTGAFWNSYRHVSADQLQPGDLVFFYGDKHHVGIYIGGGMMVHAPHTGDVVRIAAVSGHGQFSGAARVVG